MAVRRTKSADEMPETQALADMATAYAPVQEGERFEPEQHTAQAVSRRSGPRPPLLTIRITRRAVRNLVLIMIVIAALLGAARSLHWRGWGLTDQELQQQQVATLVAKVGNLMLLPQETPVIATVTDAATLRKSQAFYAEVENGDLLLLYAKASRAILYRPSTNKIINVGPVYNTANQTASAAATTATSSSAAPSSSSKK